MKIKNRILIGLVTIILLVASTYLFENIIKANGMKSATMIKITEKNKTIAFISVDVLKQLAEEENKKSDDNTISEPSLMLAMNAAGANNFKLIQVNGKDNGSFVTLNQADTNNNLKLRLENNGTVDLCKQDDKSNIIVKSVVEINIID